ncbi:putative DD41D transposase [Trichonephila clavipes]|uniref:Putative DD41D transposase n=1 Tax=Trichonephila clavipes TaxID=2585209 RepID=A0A8X6V5I6_TRICX|nr:putative DD41D transposase [Trichonephila clavipes]
MSRKFRAHPSVELKGSEDPMIRKGRLRSRARGFETSATENPLCSTLMSTSWCGATKHVTDPSKNICRGTTVKPADYEKLCSKYNSFGFEFQSDENVQELWFQQDGATCHTARATIDLLKDTFGDRLISRFGPVNWPPRSCDLTPLDYFLWGYVKSLVYADEPQTLDHLEDNIRRVIADIRPQMLEKVIENWTSSLDYIRGSPMPEIIFKM